MTPSIILVNPGLRPGGMTVDLDNLAAGLRHHGYDVTRAGGMRATRRELAGKPDALLHVFGCLPSTAILGAFALARLRRRPLIWTPTFHPIRPQTYGRSLPHVAMRAFDALAPRLAVFADAVIALTEEEGEHFRALGTPQTVVIPHGVESLRPPADAGHRQAFRARFGLDAGPVIVVVGRNSPRHKGLAFCLDTFQHLRLTNPDSQLVLVGGLGLGNGLGNDGRSASAPGVRALGWVTDQQRDLALTAADLIFVPSAYEGLSRVVLEGWATGTAVVATERVALAPLIRQHNAGRVVAYGKPAQAAQVISELIAAPAARHDCAEAGRTLVQHRFLLHALVHQVMRLYGTVSASHQSGQATQTCEMRAAASGSHES